MLFYFCNTTKTIRQTHSFRGVTSFLFFCMVIVQNGDGGATGVHMQGSTWLGDKCYAVFNNIVNTQTQMRINYLIIYTPSEYFGRYSI